MCVPVAARVAVVGNKKDKSRMGLQGLLRGLIEVCYGNDAQTSEVPEKPAWQYEG